MNLSDVPIDLLGFLPVQESHNFTLVENCFAWCYNNTVRISAAMPVYFALILALFLAYCDCPLETSSMIAGRKVNHKHALKWLLLTVIGVALIHSLLAFFIKRF